MSDFLLPKTRFERFLNMKRKSSDPKPAKIQIAINKTLEYVEDVVKGISFPSNNMNKIGPINTPKNGLIRYQGHQILKSKLFL